MTSVSASRPVAGLALLLALPAIAFAQFTQPAGSPYTTGTNPSSVAVGDFNRDGYQDIVIANRGYSNLTILFGNGGGGFTPAPYSPVATGQGPTSVAVADFNGDGLPDLVIANADGGSLTILLGSKLLGFAPAAGSPFVYPVNASPWFVTVGDFNGDGKMDIATADSGSHTVTVLLGNGLGGFSNAPGSPVAMPGGGYPWSLAVSDFNKDGAKDLAVASHYGPSSSNSDLNLTVLLGDGSGRFTTALGSPFATGSFNNGVVAGDFNGDGIPDLAAADGSVDVFLGNGSGGFSPATGSPYSTGLPSSLIAADFNGDGNLDLATANESNSNMTLLQGDGKGNFTVAGSTPLPSSATYVMATGDFNGDGKPDLAIVSTNDNNLTILLNGSGSSGGGPAPAAPGNFKAGESLAHPQTQINLYWQDNSNNEAGFAIFRSLDFGATYTLLATVGANVTFYADQRLTPLTGYYYYVKSFNAAGASAASNPDWTFTADTTVTAGPTPAAPSNVRAGQSSVNPSSQINVYWQDNAVDEAGFQIFRSTDGVNFTQIGTVPASATTYMNVTEYQDAGLPSNTVYYYYVKAYNSTGASAPSNIDWTVTAY